MKKNSLQNKLNDLRKTLIATLSSNKLKAAILAPMVLSLVACGNVSGGPDNPPPHSQGQTNIEDPNKEVLTRTITSINGIEYNSETNPTTKQELLENTQFTVTYTANYKDDTSTENIKNTYTYIDFINKFKNVTFSVNPTDTFPDNVKTITLTVSFGNITKTSSNITNGNFKEQGNIETIADVSDVLKLVMGDNEYNKIYASGKFLPSSITLTAQTIKDVGENFSGLLDYIGKEKKLETISAEHQSLISDYKNSVVAQSKGVINITKSGTDKYSLNSYNTNVVFKDEFDLSEISLPDNTDNKGNFDDAVLKGDSILLDKLNTIRGTSLPTLSITNVKNLDSNYEKTSFIVYKLYKDYSNELSKLGISGSVNSYIDGRIDSSGKVNNNYTLFTDEDKVKPLSDTSVKSLTIDALIQMYKQLKIAYFSNIIISGDAKETLTVNWRLSNIVFTGDMSKITNTTIVLTGIVYFKNKVYNALNHNVYGLLKLDNLEGVSTATLGISLSDKSAVLDVRGVDENTIKSYNSGILAKGGYAHAIYFSDYYSSYKDNKEKIKELCLKFSNNQGAGFINAYLGNTRVNGESYSATGLSSSYSIIGAKNPRSLKEFEYFGNNIEDNNVYKFEKAAKDTYSESDNLSDFDKDRLNGIFKDKIAQNNKRIEFIDPETQKVIFSVVNDRQYNA